MSDQIKEHGRQQAGPVAWVRFCSDGCYEGPLMNSSPAMDGARRTSGAWTPLFAAQPVARDVLMAALHELRDACSFAVSGDIGVKSADKVMAGVDIAAIADRYAAQQPAVAVAVPDERAAFEAWLQENIDNTDTVRPSKEKVDAYFAVWLARAALAAAPQAAVAVPDDAAKDAARYRWLRDISVPPHNFYISVPIEFHGVRYSPAEVDAAIDAAIAAQKGGEA